MASKKHFQHHLTSRQVMPKSILFRINVELLLINTKDLMIQVIRPFLIYDPIMLTSKYSIDYHVKYFNELAKRLSGYTYKCVISFVDLYRNTQSHLRNLDILPLGEKEMYELAERLVEIEKKTIWL